MKNLFLLLLSVSFLFGTTGCSDDNETPSSSNTSVNNVANLRVKMPEPKYHSETSLENSLIKRRSIRLYSDEPLKLDEVSQLLWAAQGITADWGGRTAPSAGGLYPLEVYVVVGNVENLATGVYRYEPEQHEIIMTLNGDIRSKLSDAALKQTAIRDGAINIVLAAVYERTTKKYKDRGLRYVLMETGHAAQNVSLQATAMGLGAVTIGAFNDLKISRLLNLPEDENPLYIIPVGKQ